MDIEFKEGAVCFADGKQWYSDGAHLRSSPIETASLAWALKRGDFKLNTIKQGDYISKSELDTEDNKYNRVVEVIGLFGFEPYLNYNLDVKGFCKVGADNYCGIMIGCSNAELVYNETYDLGSFRREITFNQLITIGELKRLMNERDSNRSAKPNSSVSKVNSDIERNQPKNKSKQAYAILESLDYDYDLVKQRWFRKEWV